LNDRARQPRDDDEPIDDGADDLSPTPAAMMLEIQRLTAAVKKLNGEAATRRRDVRRLESLINARGRDVDGEASDQPEADLDEDQSETTPRRREPERVTAPKGKSSDDLERDDLIALGELRGSLPLEVRQAIAEDLGDDASPREQLRALRAAARAFEHAKASERPPARQAPRTGGGRGQAPADRHEGGPPHPRTRAEYLSLSKEQRRKLDDDPSFDPDWS
jgi:hypothetical protein